MKHLEFYVARICNARQTEIKYEAKLTAFKHIITEALVVYALHLSHKAGSYCQIS